MKTLFLAALVAMLLAGSSIAGPRFGVYVNAGGYGCAPRYYAPPVCYAPRVTSYCAAPAAYYYRPAPVYYYTSAPVVYAPACAAPVYRAPIVTGGVNVSTVSFGWHR